MGRKFEADFRDANFFWPLTNPPPPPPPTPQAGDFSSLSNSLIRLQGETTMGQRGQLA